HDPLEERPMRLGGSRSGNLYMEWQHPSVFSDDLLLDFKSVKTGSGRQKKEQTAPGSAPLSERARNDCKFTQTSEARADGNLRFRGRGHERRIENAFEVYPPRQHWDKSIRRPNGVANHIDLLQHPFGRFMKSGHRFQQ